MGYMKKDKRMVLQAKKNRDKFKEKKLEPMLIDIDKYLESPDDNDCGCGDTSYIYRGLGIYECENCGKIFKNEYARVRDCVDEYGTNLSMFEISDKTGVPKRIIDLFVKDGRFVEVEKQRICKICKEPIDSGMYCNRCALRQIEKSFEEKTKKKFSSSVLNSGDMRGTMHIGKRVESFGYEHTTNKKK